MRRRLALLLVLLLPLGGCFFALDGSLVGKKRDSGADALLSDATPDAPGPDGKASDLSRDALPGEGQLGDTAGEALDLLAEGGAAEAGADAASGSGP